MNRSRKRIMPKLRLDGDPALNVVCGNVKDGEDVSHIIQAMMHILLNSKNGVGLAANQAGFDKRIILIKPQYYSDVKVLINPEFKPIYEKKERGQEACLSYPDKGTVIISRYTDISVTYVGEDGRTRIGVKQIDTAARIIQHEIDHLNGQCIVGAK